MSTFQVRQPSRPTSNPLSLELELVQPGQQIRLQFVRPLVYTETCVNGFVQNVRLAWRIGARNFTIKLRKTL